jgi:signal transduction histidine kinase
VAFIRKIWDWLWPARASFLELEQLQTGLLRSLLGLGLGTALVLTLRAYFSQVISMAPGLELLAALLLCLGMLHGYPGARLWILRFLLLICLAIIYFASLRWGSAVAPPVPLLALLGLFGTLLDSPLVGNLVTLGSLGVMEALRRRFGLPSEPVRHFWSNLLFCTITDELIALCFYHVFIRVQEQWNAQSLRMVEVNQERQALIKALFQGLQEPVQGLLRAAQRPLQEAHGDIRTQVLALADYLQGASGLRHSLGAVDDVDAVRVSLQELQKRFLELLLWLAVALLGLTALRNWMAGGLVWLPALSFAGLSALLWRVLRGKVDVEAINRSLMLFYLMLFVIGIWKQSWDGIPPTLTFLPNLVLGAALVSGEGLALFTASVGTLVIVAVWVWGTPDLPEQVTLGNMLMAMVVLAVLCRGVWRQHAALLQLLRRRTDSLAQALRQRRRLLGTLFHDINNPLMAIQAVLQLPREGLPLTPKDQERVQNMAWRIGQLLASAESFLLGDAHVPSDGLQKVKVSQVFAEMQELFEVRLKDKRLKLSFMSPAGLAVLALPEVLRDSILSNLISNALKFSPAGSSLALEAQVVGDEVVLLVRDQGPGVPDSVRQALHNDSMIDSQRGTQGETGQGLGLGLVQEHLSRLGGRLELERLAGGGTEARAWLKKA